MTVPTETPPVGKIGIWSLELRFGDRNEALEGVTELDELGFGAVWVPGGIDDKVLDDIDWLLAATRRTTIATGIINVWKQTPAQVGAWFEGLAADKRRRALLGLGISHAPIVGEAWGKPLKVMREYLDGCAAAGLPPCNLCLAALGPKMVALSGARTAGAHPYLTTPAHSAEARAILGPDRLLAPEQGVVLDANPESARAAARKAVDNYRRLPNYVNSWKRLGFTQDEIDGMSDRFIDAIFAWGSVERIAERVQAHLSAGADHVCLQVIPSRGASGFAAIRPAWRELAAALL
ncbi:MAG: TIGR03620 family F420-dependent LLM class oxidoreductase [Novosphingobium sp.]